MNFDRLWKNCGGNWNEKPTERGTKLSELRIGDWRNGAGNEKGGRA